MTRRLAHFILLLVGSFGLAGCDRGSETTPPVAATDITPEAQAFYAAHPDFFHFRTLADLPPDLPWQDGSDLPEIGSDEAKKGGIQYGSLQDFPRTLRTVGPDSNGSFRPFILDYTSIQLAHRHPDNFDYYPGTAKAWAVDQANKTVYIKLYPDARWSDGVPLTADDFVFMFFFYQTDYIVAPWYKNWYGTQYTNITRYDDHTFSVTIPDAKPDMDSRVLELQGVPQHFFKELGDDFVDRYQWKFVPTTGPYVVLDEDIKKGRSIALTRINDWWARDKKFWKNRYNTS
jgi:microcin C transport system substrate-binding protein